MWHRHVTSTEASPSSNDRVGVNHNGFGDRPRITDSGVALQQRRSRYQSQRFWWSASYHRQRRRPPATTESVSNTAVLVIGLVSPTATTESVSNTAVLVIGLVSSTEASPSSQSISLRSSTTQTQLRASIADFYHRSFDNKEESTANINTE